MVDRNYEKALTLLEESIETFALGNEWRAWKQVELARALHGLGQSDRAKRELYDALQTCVEISAFLPLMHLMPVISVVLAASDDQTLQERAVELYAMARTLPFVANSKLFKVIAERPLQEEINHLPQDTLQTAQSRGQNLDWWETAAVLLDELRKLGWAGSSEKCEPIAQEKKVE
jgi:hypothetical protein